jgi:hypothetical protein
MSGGITVSGFGGGCHRGTGPCEGGAARELSAAQKGQLLQVRRGQAPQLLQGNGALAPDVVAPPRADEPGKGGLSGTDPSLDPRKSESLQGQQIATQTPTQPIVTPPLVVNPVDPPVVTAQTA